MQKIRSLVPLLLDACGLATFALCLFLALLSADNPLAAFTLLLGGLTAMAVLMGFGERLSLQRDNAARLRQIQGDVRALSNTFLEFLQKRDGHATS